MRDKTQYIIFALYLIISILGCSKKDSEVVARFGEQCITMAEFQTAYLEVLKQPDKYDSKELREAFLDEMINRRILAQAAKDMELPQDELTQLKLEAYHNKCLRETHYQQVIEPRISIDDSLVTEVYRYTREQRKLKHLFFPSPVLADSAYKLLQHGVGFDDLATIVFQDSALAQSGGDLGWVYWDQLEFDMAVQAFRQKVNTFSAPVKSSYGYHIIFVDDLRREVFVTKTDLELHREDAEYMVKTKLGEKIAYEYISSMMENASIQVRPSELELVGRTLKKLFSESSDDNLSRKSLAPEEIDSLETTLWDVRNRPLFYVDNEIFTIGQFVTSLAYIPPYLVRRSYKTALDYVIRDALLTREAKNIGLDKDRDVRIKSRLFEEYRLQIALRKKIIEQIQVSDAEIQKMYEEMTASSASKKPLDNYKEDLRRIIHDQKRATEVPRYLQQLKTGLSIEKNSELIHRYSDGITN